MIKCMCHEVAAAASERARAIFGKPRVAERSDPPGSRESSAARGGSHFLEDDFCVFSHTVMRDILDAKHAKHTFWGSTHWCGSDESVSKAVAQMTLADVGALLVMDRVSLDRDKNDVIDEDELRAAPRERRHQGHRLRARLPARGGTGAGDALDEGEGDHGGLRAAATGW